jgi:hypothetical protein
VITHFWASFDLSRQEGYPGLTGGFSHLLRKSKKGFCICRNRLSGESARNIEYEYVRGWR